jgi:hypothetical protein
MIECKRNGMREDISCLSSRDVSARLGRKTMQERRKKGRRNTK